MSDSGRTLSDPRDRGEATPGRCPSGHYVDGRAFRPYPHVAEEAVRTLMRHAGMDPAAPGLADVPGVVCRGLEWFRREQGGGVR